MNKSATQHMYDQGAEEALLGSIIVNPSGLDEICAVIKGSKDFRIAINGDVYDILVKMHDQDLDIDLVSVSAFLKPGDAQHTNLKMSQLKRGEADTRLSRYVNACDHATSGVTYARIVRRFAIMRTCVATYEKAVQLIINNGLDITEVLRKTIEMLEKYLDELE